ncbi:hypothetical protein [Paenibacillus hamazuiensis]|uniref:hypothetical protein n=1 Tax=Paenibacillus hamazuiensis TaxID=2936508 RepID=UPI00200BAF3D|nr:hypothetical protein [Paenibacillus hamazuiensis]
MDYLDTSGIHDPYHSRRPRTSAAATAGLVLGIIAIVLNALLITLPLGFVAGVLSLIFSLLARKRYRLGLGGLLASGVSFFIVLVWLISLFVPLMADPTLGVLQR